MTGRLFVEVGGGGGSSYSVDAVVDPGNVIPERYENNNTYSATFS